MTSEESATNAKVEAAARALAAMLGHNPDGLLWHDEGTGITTDKIDGRGRHYHRAWRRFADEARDALTAFSPPEG